MNFGSSVELNFVYLLEGCGYLNENKRYNTPHLNSMRCIHKQVHSHISIQGMSVVRLSSCCENCQIFYLGLRKHFQYVCYPSDNATKLKIIFQTNKHSVGYCSCIYTKIVFCRIKRLLNMCKNKQILPISLYCVIHQLFVFGGHWAFAVED